MKKTTSKIPEDAVLLIPEPERENEPAPFGIKPGYYNSKELLGLIDQHKNDCDAIQFLADMLETGDPASDGFAEMLRANRTDSRTLTEMVRAARK